MTLDQMTLGTRVRTLTAVLVWPGIAVPGDATGTVIAVGADDCPGGARQILLDQRVVALDPYENVLVVFPDDIYDDDPVTAAAFTFSTD